MAVPPSECSLDDAVKLAETEATRHDQAPPDCRLDTGKRNADLEGVGFIETHAGKYTGDSGNWQPARRRLRRCGSLARSAVAIALGIQSEDDSVTDDWSFIHASHDGAGRGCCACIQSAACCALLAAVKMARGSPFRTLSQDAI